MALYELDGNSPQLAPGAWVADSAQVIGKVELGEGANIWFGAVARGDNEPIRIGRGSNIQDLSMLHSDLGVPLTIGDNVTVGHAAVIHGCTIEDQCLIGMGAILLNGAHVGAGSIVAAGTLLVEGQKIPPRSLVMGSPGKVKRLLTQAEVADIQLSADRYAGYRLDYMEQK